MASILLPTTPGPRAAKMNLMSFGTVLTPFLGGPTQRINRLGTRWSMMVSMPPLKAEPDGRVWASALAQAVESGAVMPIVQDIDTGAPGAPVVSANVASGSILPLSGVTPGYQLRAGQFISIIHAGRRYVYTIREAVTVGVGGAVSASIFPLLRTALSTGDVVEVATPMIEGWIDSAFGWDVLQTPMIQIPDFTIVEAA
jgi:hypothetical protein